MNGKLSEGQVRWSGALIAAGGVSLAAFVLIHPFDQLAGAQAMHHSRWIPAHTLHFLGSVFAILGLPALYVRNLSRAGASGLIAFLLAFVGTAMFAGTGLITAYLWPLLAKHAPALIEGDGAIFTDRLSTWVTAAPYALMVPGYALIAVVLMRARSMPLVAGLLLIAGVLLFAAPVHPVGPAPWILRVTGGVLFGAALVWLGYRIWTAPRTP